MASRKPPHNRSPLLRRNKRHSIFLWLLPAIGSVAVLAVRHLAYPDTDITRLLDMVEQDVVAAASAVSSGAAVAVVEAAWMTTEAAEEEPAEETTAAGEGEDASSSSIATSDASCKQRLTEDESQHFFGPSVCSAHGEEPRFENTDQSGAVWGPDELLQPDTLHALLGQALTDKRSRWLNNLQQASDEGDEVRLWSVRLIFAAMYWHQYGPAWKCKNEGVCADDTKYVTVSLAGNGLGSNVRGGAVVAMAAGLQMNRVVIFANGVDGYKIWPLASCPRRDYQCFFRPVTPCTLTVEQVKKAYQFTAPELRRLRRKQEFPAAHVNSTVVRLQLSFTPELSIPKAARERLSNIAHGLIDRLPCDTDMRIPILRRAADLILEQGEKRQGYDYAAAAQKVQHAAAFFFLRPTNAVQERIASTLATVIPDSLQPDRAIGLPIRGSDKCAGESECLTFEQHMQVVDSLWSKEEQHQNDASAQVVFTTESKSVVAEQKEYAAKESSSFEFVTNFKDVTPDTGFIKEVRDHSDTADEAMISALSSFSTQLLPTLSIGNCCSNFHTLLNDYLSEGLGAAAQNRFVCLQEHDDPLLRVCCGWHHDCKRTKKKLLAELAAATANNAATSTEG